VTVEGAEVTVEGTEVTDTGTAVAGNEGLDEASNFFCRTHRLKYGWKSNSALPSFSAVSIIFFALRTFRSLQSFDSEGCSLPT
jgi:hypothetical protein